MGKEYQIAVLPGDGIGPEVVAEGLKVLKRTSEIEGFKYKLTRYPHGSEHYLKTNELFPDSVLNELREQDAIYLGAIGDPRVEVGLVERAVIAGIRFGLDLYVNLRPIKLLAEHLCPLKDKKPEDIDMVVVRENTEDLYAGIGGFLKKGTADEVALQEMVFTRKGCERVVRFAFDRAAKRRKKLTLVDKANAIQAMDIWTRTFADVGMEYPQVATDHAYIDAACMWLVKNPEQFDTVVTNNIFGDILTDLGAVLQGGMGIAASGNIHPGKVSMFEPIHGSAPKYKNKGVASPVAAIAACGMMLEYLGEARAANRIERAIAELLKSRKIPALDSSSGLSTSACGELIARQLAETNV